MRPLPFALIPTHRPQRSHKSRSSRPTRRLSRLVPLENYPKSPAVPSVPHIFSPEFDTVNLPVIHESKLIFHFFQKVFPAVFGKRPPSFLAFIRVRHHLNLMNHLRIRRALLAFFSAHLISLAGAAEAHVSFRNDIMPLLSKAGCNAGACHGNANGKAGFKLSLRGESPDLDYFALTHDQLARRVNPLNPADSLLLEKPTTALAHEGGQRFKKDSREYDLLRRWIAEGARDDADTAPRLERLEAGIARLQPGSPAAAAHVIIEPTNSIQIHARAIFSNGEQRDLTSIATYESSNPSLKISSNGLVESSTFGEATVLARFLNQQIPVRLAFIAARPDFKWSKPRENNFIDHEVFTKLRSLRMNPSGVCSDEVFLRRAYLDLLGILPGADEARAFTAAKGKNKRSKLIDQLLERGEFADFWALKWSDLLRNEERLMDRKGVEVFHHWVRQSIFDKKPLDQFARELVSARGSTYLSPAANYYRANRDPVSRAEAAAMVFLGARLQCAQCHSHPFDRWTQDDYYDWAGVFARIDYKVLENRRRDENDKHEFKGEQVVYLASKSDFKNARTGQQAQPRFLGSTNSIPVEADELDELAAWITDAKNPFFARAQVNRIWFHMMGRGLVDPVDDFRATNPASHPELLEELAREFIKSKYDLRHMIRLIANSRAYQLSAEPNETNRADDLNYSHTMVRRLTAEQLLDAQSHLAGAPINFTGYPLGTHATQLPGGLAEKKRDQKKTEADTFLAEFGKPPRLLPSECERSCEPTMSQAFQLISGPAVTELLTRKDNRLDQLLASKKTDREIITDLFWAALTRAPSPRELEKFSALLAKSKNRRATLEDLAWSLANSKEFLFRR